ncbi:uncharacterized protein GIQ15_04418 [Arthroderma uncinatum]|uniref:uncharacterized protein n=1 Tax=Arthroderma uncinatum TaxID=74035 RepID=UPI00144ACF29|nr:uncharacterized protein GIQ15_04418 [Arthroderma uncinatum]KAF3481659.1 hypothetical protein GIQ15_04418 [Arthroderma uncinatum]
MAAHVVVLDASARRALVKVTPTKHMSDVLGDACAKFNINPAQYGLKLELVQLSKSPSVVSIALQLPDSESQGTSNGRLVDKFPSNTTLWLILRKFESGVAGSSKKFNLTARGAPQVQEGESGSGRLFYETPVLNILGKELSSFTDLQKPLSQLGLNNGSALIRLSFRITDQPLEEAMVDIDTYFKSLGGDKNVVEPSEAPSSAAEAVTMGTPVSSEDASTADTQVPVIISSRPVTVFAPPSNSTPHSAQTPYNERDYLPTIEHAQTHQKRLNTASRPNRLAGDAELAAQEAAVQEKLSKVKEIEVKIRFPDQSQAVSKFTTEDTTKSLYAFAKSCLDAPLADEKFSLFYFPALTVGARPGSNVQVQILESEDKALIRDLKMSGRVLVNFVWDTNAALSARSAGGSVLRPELRQAAGKLQVNDIAADEDDENEGKNKSGIQKTLPSSSDHGKKKSGVPKWLKLPGKK